ncbi:MAG: peptidase S41 [Gammaproteobacteria bacterium]|nr:MAG: peptidase S41 [Gammaproteobacteria bacterium]
MHTTSMPFARTFDKYIMKKGILIGLTILLTHLTNAQDCSCADNFAWLKETIEKNEASFQYMVEQKGEQEYQKHSDTYADKVKTITDKQECAETLLNWLRFFQHGHLWIGLNNDHNSNGQDGVDTVKIREQFSTWETYPYNEEEFNSYVSKITEPGFEGIWNSPSYTIGIRKVKDEYIGFVIEADGVYWSKSQVKFKIRRENNKFTATYYMQDHSPKEFSDVELLGNNYLQMGFVTLKRVKPIFPADKHVDMYFRFMTTQVPLFEKLSDNTAILRIPSFSLSEKKFIDSIIDANWQTITSTENLIIDLRNNGGGSDLSYEKILPIIYTNPIRTVGVELLSTPLNNQALIEFMNDPDLSEEDKNWVNDALEKLNQHIGEFVNLDSTIVTIKTFDTIYPYPKNVGIIIDKGSASATEQFLLAAKQSKKVKLFGTTTAGVLDFSNMYFVDSPCKDLKLGYSISRSMRIPDMTIDGKGIQPDYYIDKTISKYDWIDFVNRILNYEEK